MIRYASDTNKFEAYENGAWTDMISAGGGGLTNFTESVNSAAPNATVPVVSLTANNAATNVDIALTPKGTGALTAQVADGTATGGNKRGTGAVDWQLIRGSAIQVASGSYSTVAGGASNRASGLQATVTGGSFNIASGDAAVAGGTSNTASGNYSTVVGGASNTANLNYATVAGGTGNTASGYGSFVAGGTGNTASAYYSMAANNFTTADAYAQTTFGQYNSPTGSENASSWVATDPLFVVGNGTSSAAKSNAVTILKNGNVGIGTTTPGFSLDVSPASGNAVLKIDAPAGSNTQLKLMDEDVAHGMTAVTSADTFGRLLAVDNVRGGLSIEGYNDDGAVSGIAISGMMGSSTPTATQPAVLIKGLKQSGASVGAMGTSETVFQVLNDSSNLITALGGGNIGIGTATPQAGLDVATTGTAASAIIVPRDTVANRPSTPVNGMIRYASDTNKFEAYENGAWTDMISAGGGGSSAAGSDQQVQFNNSGSFGASANFTWDNTNGRLGIGTSTPYYKLHVIGALNSGTSPFNATLTDSAAYSADVGGGLSFGGFYNGSSTTNLAGIRGGKENSTLNDTAGYLALYTHPNGGDPTERMHISSSGDVGIGTTSPQADLDVERSNSGTHLLVQNSTSSGHANWPTMTVRNYQNGLGSGHSIIEMQNAGGSAGAQSAFGGNRLIGSFSYGGSIDSSNFGTSASVSAYSTTAFTSSSSPGELRFSTTPSGATDPVDRLTVRSDGKVGIGTTVPGQQLTVAGTIESTSGGVKFPDATTQTTSAFNDMLVVDEKTAGTQGGTCTSGSWFQRTLNTVRFNNISGASLASNQITLPAGTYYIRACSTGMGTNEFRGLLYDVTGSANLVVGTTAQSDQNSSGATVCSRIEGQFTLAVQSQIELRHRCYSTLATVGLGSSGGNWGIPEVYSTVYIQKR
jgi:hypothetical protein